MPAQQSNFVLDLSKPVVIFWHRDGGALTRLTKVPVDDSQIVQKLRANRISAEVDGPPTVEIQLPVNEVTSQFLRVSGKVGDPAMVLRDLLMQDHDDAEIFISEDTNVVTGAAVSRATLEQAAEFAKGIGLVPTVFTCPDLTQDLGIVPEFFLPIAKPKRNFLPLASAAALALVVGLFGVYWSNSESLTNSAYSSPDLSSTNAPAPFFATERSAPEPDTRIWNASLRTPQSPRPEATTDINLLEIARAPSNEPFPHLLERYVPLASYRVAQALSDTVSDQTRSTTISPNLRPFTLGQQDPILLRKVQPNLRPSVFNPPAAEVVPEPETVIDAPAVVEATTEAATAEPPLVEEVSQDPSLSEPDVIAEPVPEPVVTPEVPVPAVITPEVAETVTEPAAQPEEIAEPRGPLPKLRPTGLQETVTTALDEANRPAAHPAHKGYAPKARPNTVTARVKAITQAKEAEKQRTNELLEIAKAEELERAKQRELERQQKAQEAAIALEIERSKPQPKPFAYPDLRPRNFARTVARIDSNEKARAASVPKTNSTTSASVDKSSTEKARIKNTSLTLIGIAGGSNSRRAIVKLRGGGYKTVKKGQTIAGWRISAIGESSVRIRKGGRDQVLRMPK